MKNEPNEVQTGPSAAGERRALIGLLPQYRAAATAVLDALHHRALEFLEIAHDSNGAVDDFVIGSPLTVKAYQVKWREYPASFTFRRLVTADKDGRTLIRDLFEGQQQLKARYPAKRIIVHLYTCDYPSNNDKCHPNDQQQSLSFAKFLDQVWKPAQTGDTSGAKTEPAAWKALFNASGATERQFLQFVPDCELIFGVQVGGEPLTNSRDRSLERDQIRELAQLLISTVSSP